MSDKPTKEEIAAAKAFGDALDRGEATGELLEAAGLLRDALASSGAEARAVDAAVAAGVRPRRRWRLPALASVVLAAALLLFVVARPRRDGGEASVAQLSADEIVGRIPRSEVGDASLRLRKLYAARREGLQ